MHHLIVKTIDAVYVYSRFLIIVNSNIYIETCFAFQNFVPTQQKKYFAQVLHFVPTKKIKKSQNQMSHFVPKKK